MDTRVCTRPGETTSNYSLATDEKLTTNFIVGDFSCAVHGKTLRI